MRQSRGRAMSMRTIAASLCAAMAFALLLAWLTIPRDTVAQTGDYDTDNDGLIEIRALEQLNAVRWDLDGDGEVDAQTNQTAYAAAFPNAEPHMGCPDSGCVGYELARDLDFDDPVSYASGAVNTKWTTGAGWLPIGLTDNAFSATFDGNDYTIANLYIKRSGCADPGVVGLFGSMDGYINRTGLIDVDVSGVDAVGGLVGLSHGQISESYARGDVLGNEVVGGLVGENDGTISDSYATGPVSEYRDIGGLVGRNVGGEISVSYATGNVSGTDVVGGLVGQNFGGQISASYATGSVSGTDVVGGLVGQNFGGQISTSYAAGSVSGSDYVGGLVGESGGWRGTKISASYAAGSVSGSDYVGGLVGCNLGHINESYASGEVSGSEVVGGLVGCNLGTIYAAYATGSVSEESLVGGLIGQNSGVIYAGYWDTQTTGQSSGVGEGSADGAAGKTTAELQSPTGYTGIYGVWLIDFDNADNDFDDTTGVDDFWNFGIAAQYPALKADFDGDGVATWDEFGDQRGQSPVPALTPTPEPTPVPTPAPQADLELTMLLSDYLGFLWYYLIVENNGPANATGIVLTDSLPDGVSPVLSIPVAGTCSGEKPVMCELGNLTAGSKTLVMIIARLDDPLSQNVPANTASVTAAESDPYPANNEASE